MTRTFVKYLLGLALLGVALAVLAHNGLWERFAGLTAAGAAVMFGLLGLVFLTSGVRLGYLSRRQYGRRLHPADTLWLPVMMNLWGMIFPVKGGMLFCMVFLKSKYGVRMSAGSAMNVNVYILLVVTGGAFLGVTAMLSGGGPRWLAAALLLCASPVALWLAAAGLRRLPPGGSMFRQRVQGFLQAVTTDTLALWKERGQLVALLALTVVNFGLYVMWVYATARGVDIALGWPGAVLVTLVLHLAMILRLIPGNLGVDELLTGGTLAMAGASLGEGVLLGITLRAQLVVTAALVGLPAFLLNLRHFRGESWLSLWRRLQREQQEQNGGV